MTREGRAWVERRIANRMAELTKVVRMVDRFGVARGLAPAVVNDLNLVLDEVLNNIVSYGYPTGGAGTIRVRLEHDGHAVRAEVEDDGIAFEPLPPPPLLPGAVRRGALGGAGLRVIFGLMDGVAYDRVDGRNRLRLTKRLALLC